ncbi:FixH family protein [Altererythrobacter sp. MF3-039]|uniref:FixH family protein n=1 Tax=Altererythrobacter sp. MF3-039 TaxID=3252901 RepID=UPI00390C4686
MMQREFTGRDMAKVLVAGFGVVFAVNMLMATLAAQSFSGVIVENSYAASQKFNGWLEEARKSEELGWSAQLRQGEDGYLTLETIGVPLGAQVSAQLRRPLGEREEAGLEFAQTETGAFRSVEPIATGRWIARITIAADVERWTSEVPLE